MAMLQIMQALDDEDVDHVRALFQEYAMEWPGSDLEAENFEDELTNLPEGYDPPHGRLLLAISHGQPAGCIALKQLGDGVCEIKRLYVRPQFRGLRIGRSLAEAIIGEARKIGYARVRLDTVQSMEMAKSLYRSLGFKEIDAYNDKQMRGTIFMELTFNEPGGAPNNSSQPKP